MVFLSFCKIINVIKFNSKGLDVFGAHFIQKFSNWHISQYFICVVFCSNLTWFWSWSYPVDVKTFDSLYSFFQFFAYTAPHANNFWTVYIVLKLTTQFLFRFVNDEYFTFGIFIFLINILHCVSCVWIIFVIEKSLESLKKNLINAMFFFDVEKYIWLKNLINECQNRLFLNFFFVEYCLCLSLHVCFCMFLKECELFK